MTGGTLFEELGFYYVGPIDGHNLDHLLPVLKNVRDAHTGPILIHVVTQKGKGYAPAEESDDKYHGVNTFDVITGTQVKPKANFPDLHQGVRREPDPGGTRGRQDRRRNRRHALRHGRGSFRSANSRRAPSMSASPSSTRSRSPLAWRRRATSRSCAIYSTFLQRAYDQVVHDVAIQNLPVRFALDRAGLVGADGPTHAGLVRCRLSRLPAEHGHHGRRRRSRAGRTWSRPPPRTIPAPSPSAIRAAKASASTLPDAGVPLEIGKGRVLREGSRVALLSLGTRLAECLKAADELAALRLARHGRRCTLRQAARHGTGGTAGTRPRGAHHRRGRLDRRFRLLRACSIWPRRACWTAACACARWCCPTASSTRTSPSGCIARAGLDASAIVAKVLEAMPRISLDDQAIA